MSEHLEKLFVIALADVGIAAVCIAIMRMAAGWPWWAW